MISLHTLPARLARDLAGVLSRQQLNAGTVLMHWESALLPADANIEGDYAASAVVSRRLSALIHWVSVRTGERGFGEFQAGDAIITFAVPMGLEGKRGVSFTLPDGKDYVQQAVGKKVVEFWDTYVGGAPLTTTLLLRSTGGAAAVRRCLVRHVAVGGAVTDLYAFDLASRTLSVLDETLLDGRALIDRSAPGTCLITIGGTLVLAADASGVQVGTLDADGGGLAEEPRLEWVRGSTVLAALGQSGILAVGVLEESLAAPAATDAFELLNAGWLLSFGTTAATVPEILETL